MIAIALGMTIMVISILVVTGFRNQISDKVIGFGSHIQISNFDNNNSYEETPISATPLFLKSITDHHEVKSIFPYASKAGIIRTDDEIEGVILKGYGTEYGWDYFSDKLISGSLPTGNSGGPTKYAMISSSIAKRLELGENSEMIVYFVEQPPRIRKFIISGIYETGLEEFDKLYAFCDISIIRNLNSWNDTLVGGFEIQIKDPSKIDKLTQEIYQTAGYQYNTMSIKERFPQIFHWLDLQDMNVFIILGLIILVSGVSMISILLIIILDNATTIGVLKSLGATNKSVKSIFIRVALPIIFYGLILGNGIGLGLGMLQYHFGIIKLPVESYYVAQVPIHFSFSMLIFLNLGTIFCCFLMLIWPSSVIARIRPARVLKFD